MNPRVLTLSPITSGVKPKYGLFLWTLTLCLRRTFSVCLRRGTFSFSFVKSTMCIMFIKALYNIFFLSLKDALTFSLFVCEEVLLVFALLNPQCVLCFLRHYIIFFYLKSYRCTFSGSESATCLFHEDVLSLRECFTIWYKNYLSCIYSIRTVFIAKKYLNKREGARL